MNVIRRRGWEMPESRATPEHLFFNRRAFLGAAAGAAAIGLVARLALAQRVADLPDPTADLYPAKRNEKYVLDRPLTDEKVNANYNNFYEFGSQQEHRASAAQALKIRPWTIKIDGMVEKPFEIGIDDLIRKVGIEERLYRMRCVEAWSMTIPWSGFPMAKLVEFAKPLSSAKYVRMETFLDKSIAPGQRQTWFPWPYVEGAHHRGGDQRARLPGHRRLRQAGAQAARRADPPRGAVEVRLQVDQVDRARSASPTSGRRAIGKTCSRPSTASGPTSIRRCRIRAGARRPRNSSAPAASASRRCCSTATANMSPGSTRAWRASGSGPSSAPAKEIPNAAVRPRLLFHAEFRKGRSRAREGPAQ